jgi:hypothetical protein
MIKPEQIPDEVLEAAARAMHADWVQGGLDEDETALPSDYATWNELDELELTFYFSQARAAVIAALNAWPGAKVAYFLQGKTYVLPLPIEDAE